MPLESQVFLRMRDRTQQGKVIGHLTEEGKVKLLRSSGPLIVVGKSYSPSTNSKQATYYALRGFNLAWVHSTTP